MNVTEAAQGWIEIPGGRLAYDRRGAGEAVVLLHAGIADRRMWEPQLGPLAARFQAVRYERPGFGQSAAVRGRYRDTDHLAALLDQLGVERAHLVGCSQGGLIALDFTLIAPQRVRSLALVCAAVGGFEYDGPPAPGDAALDAAYEEAEARGDRAAMNEIEIRYFVDGPHRSPDQTHPGARRLALEMNAVALASEGVGERVPLEPAAAGRLGEIACPTLVVSGALDRPGAAAAAQLLGAGIAGARGIVLPGVGHLPSLEDPEALNAALLPFLLEAAGG